MDILKRDTETLISDIISFYKNGAKGNPKLDGTKKYYQADEEQVEKYATMHLLFEWWKKALGKENYT